MAEEIVIKIDGEYSGYENVIAVLEEQMSISKENIILLVGEIAGEISVRLSQEVLPELIVRVNELNSAMEQSYEQSRLVTAGMSVEKRLKDTGLISNFANFISSVYHCLTNFSCKHIINV